MKAWHPALVRLLGLLFALTALAAVWVAYDRLQAWARFGLMAAGLGLMVIIAWAGGRWGEAALGPIGLACAGLAAALGAYYLLGADWQAGASAKLAALQPIGLWLQAHRPDVALPEDIHPNVAGSVLAVLLPLGMAGCAWAWSRGRRALGLASAVASLLAAVALVLTASRGAWLGLAVGGAMALGLRLLPPGWPSTVGRFASLVLVVALLFAPVVAVSVAGPAVDRFFGGVSALGAAQGRPALWRDAMTLIGDTPFTGSGLGSTAMIYSSYVLLIHDPYILHMHNLFLQMAVEQGLPGLIAFLGLLVAALWVLLVGPAPRGSAGALWFGSIVSLVALAVHGTVDAGLYVSKAVLILFVPEGMAFALATIRKGYDADDTQRARFGRRTNANTDGAGGGGQATSKVGQKAWLGFVLAAAAAALLLPASQAAFQANLGAVSQARAELSVYKWPKWPIQDALRRSPDVDLKSAIVRYQAALALDPDNVTANRRLGQIEISRGDFEAAGRHLEAAYAAAPGQRAVQLLLGEIYAAAGKVDEAAALWSRVEGTRQAFDERAWWYGSLRDAQRQEWVAEAARRAGEQ